MYKVHIPYNETSIASSMYAKYMANELKSKLPKLEFITEELTEPPEYGDNDILLVIIDGLQINILCFYEILKALILEKTVIVYSKDEIFKLMRKENVNVECIEDLLKVLKEIK